MSQKRHLSIQVDPKVLNFFDTFKFMATDPINVFEGILTPAESDDFALTDIEVKFVIMTPILETIQIG
jgi:hypothetical protein